MVDQAYLSNMSRSVGSTDYDAMAFVVNQIVGRMATCTTALVKAVDTVKKRVSIQPMAHQLDGSGNAVPHGTIFDVPYLRLQGGANAVIIDPAVGDIGIAVFAHSDISSVKNNQAPSNPGTRRRFDWSDALYIGGVLNAPPTQSIEVAQDAITITGTGTININAPGGANITAPTVAIDGDATVSGDLTVSGKMTTADLTASGTVELADATVSGAMTTADIMSSGTISAATDVVAAGKSGKSHTHSGVSTGSGTSGPPS